jgi:photosystem II stability/assembly factor-like uncharacterized protein
MAPSIRRSLVLGLLLVAVPAVHAQTWAPVGPQGGDVRSLAADPTNHRRLYLGTADGVFYRSDDSGGRWQRMSPGFPQRGKSLDEIAVDPRGVVYVGYWEVAGKGGGVARSVDGGRTFKLLPGIQGESVRALAIAPSNPDVVVAGTLAGVFRSRDAGANWQRLTPAEDDELRNVESLAIDPGYPDVIYVGTWHLPWKTVDGGATWRSVKAGIITDSDIFTITLDKRDPQTVYATACSGMYRSFDGGMRFTKFRGIPSSSRRTRSFAQDPERPDTLYAGTTEGLWATDDGGGSWRLTTQKTLVVNKVLVLPGGSVLIGTDGAGVLRSGDGGRTWFTSNAGFSERFVSRIAFDPATRRMLVGIWGDRHHGGVFSAPGPQGPWTKLGSGLEGREVLSLAVAGSAVLAGTDDGLFLSVGAGSWRRLPTVIADLDVHPRVTDVTALSDRVFLAGTSAGLLRTSDGGETWRRPSVWLSGPVAALAASARQPGVMMAATPMAFFRSRDGGETWTAVSRSMGADTHGLAILPGNDRVVFASTGAGLYRSADQGQTWTRCARGIPFSDITGLAAHPDGRTLYASDFTWGGVFRSQDGGDSWERLPTTGLVTDRVWTVGVDPAAPDRVMAASPAGGLHIFVPPPAPATAAAPAGPSESAPARPAAPTTGSQ